MKLYEDFWDLYNKTNVKLYKKFIKKIEAQEYSDRFMKPINRCLKFFYDNFNEDVYIGEIIYHGYGDTNFYLTIKKPNEEKEFNILFSIKANKVDLSYVMINGEHLYDEDRESFINNLIGYGYIYE